ncbi:putative non-specific lipid-transfer protein [Apostichopus japonicus]|uniref:Sterol carrier protein 2 n=1 Tax=Stichopus japonicus TaxID=307972 RepID=A0A2G8JYR3_STIJA|nr:putative non-specific lipid-transfer protein [Apostichopus japonicus]
MLSISRSTLSTSLKNISQRNNSSILSVNVQTNSSLASAEEMAPNKRKTFVVGVGMTKFEKPGRGTHDDFPEMAKEATNKALADAGLTYDQIEQAAVGYCYGDSTCGQKALYGVGMTGIPIYNVNNNCSTGSTALILAKNLVEGGLADCVLALGFEKMQPGSLKNTFSDRANPMEDFVTLMAELQGFAPSPPAAQLFANAGREHMAKYVTSRSCMIFAGQILTSLDFPLCSDARNQTRTLCQDRLEKPQALHQEPIFPVSKEYTLDQIKASPLIHDPVTKLQCCPTSDGSAAAIVCSEEFVHKHNLQANAVEILAMEMVTDGRSTFDDKSSIKLVGYDMTKKAAEKVFSKAGKTPEDVQVIELHDCFSANELITYEALGLCPEGKAGEFIDAGDNTYGGKYVINPSGGLISKGHPLGATGLAQCTELNWQLRNKADKRQVPGVKLALQHNIGLGGAVVVALYQKGFPEYSQTALYPATTAAGAFKAEPVFDLVQSTLKTEGAEYVKKVKAVFAFNVTDGPGGAKETWVIDVKNGNGSVTRGSSNKKADCTFTMKDSDLYDLMLGKLQPQAAFFSGKLKFAGNMAVAMKLQQIMPKVPPANL